MNHFHEAPHTFVGEVSITVTDLARSLAFYTKLLGFQIIEQTSQSAALSADGKRALLRLEQPDGAAPKQPRTSGLYHFAVLLPERRDLARFLRHLINSRYPFGAADHYVSEALYLNDPDGNGIEVYCDRPAESWTWQGDLVNMATEALDGDSILAESSEAFTALPPKTVIGHIHLHVNDVELAEQFYTRALGFQVVSYYPQAAFLSTGRYHHHIAVNTWQGTGAPRPDPKSAGLNWYTLVFPDESALGAAAGRLQEIGAPAAQTKQGVLTEDPAGNQIYLVVEK